MTALGIITIFLLVGLNAFFVAAEFALVAVRPSRVAQLIDQGNTRALVVRALAGDLDRVLSGVQVGITLASLALGIVGEYSLVRLFEPLFGWLPAVQAKVVSHTTALGLAFVLLTFMHVVLGELVPKSLALQRTEGVALLVARPLQWFLRVFHFAIRGLDLAAQKFVRAMGVANPRSHALVHSAEELLILVQQVRERGVLEAGEERFIQGAVELGQLQVREIMVPRPDMHVLPVDANLEEVMKTFATTQRSRIPVYQGALDQIIGFVHIKDMVWVLLDRERRAEEGVASPEFDLRRMLRDVLIVPESKPADELLTEMRVRRANLAMVVDEFGSILGMVTLEDILEQVVGEIHDEFDVIEQPLTLADGTMIFDAALNVHDLEARYHITLPEDATYETVGGFVVSHLGFIPRGGESFEFDEYRFTVVEMDRRRVARVKIQRVKHAPPAVEGTPRPGGARPEASGSESHPASAPRERHSPVPSPPGRREGSE